MNKWVRLVIAVLICQSAGFIGSLFTTPSIATWYDKLQKPFFSPPNWVFAPVWLTLYTLMGISLYLVWNKDLKNKAVKTSILVFAVQLVLNVSWSFLFFGLQNPFYGLMGIVILWIAILVTIFKFYKVDRRAGIILLPYILWVSIATALNYYVFILNPP
jgi:tryptophan-rich sensory protein